jgi:hypothetical protein
MLAPCDNAARRIYGLGTGGGQPNDALRYAAAHPKIRPVSREEEAMDSDVIRTTRLATTDRSGWLALVAKALGGADFDKSLLSRTDDEIRIDPLYSRARDVTPSGRIDPRKCWSIAQRVDDTDPERANRQALDDIGNGATG